MRIHLVLVTVATLLAACEERSPGIPSTTASPTEPTGTTAALPSSQAPSPEASDTAGVATGPLAVGPRAAHAPMPQRVEPGTAGTWGPPLPTGIDPSGMGVRVEGPVIDRPGDGDLPQQGTGTPSMPARTEPDQRTTPGSTASPSGGPTTTSGYATGAGAPPPVAPGAMTAP